MKMRIARFGWLGITFVLMAGMAGAGTVKSYEVRRALTPPTVDGVVNSASGEWANAAPAAGNFVQIDTGDPVAEDMAVSFQALRTESTLYFLVLIRDSDIFPILATGDDSNADDEDILGTATGQFYASLGDDLEIFLEPTEDIRRNNDPPSRTPDQYHIALTLETTHADPLWGIVGFDDLKRDVLEETGPPYQFTAAGYDLELVDGDPNVWDPAMQIGITLLPDNIAPDTAIVELAIPFSSFNYTGDMQSPPVYATDNAPDNSLVVTHAPRDGDRWAFQVGRLTNEAITLVWNRPSFTTLYARPFGELIFADGTGVADWAVY
jgi:hypothetical protein